MPAVVREVLLSRRASLHCGVTRAPRTAVGPDETAGAAPARHVTEWARRGAVGARAALHAAPDAQLAQRAAGVARTLGVVVTEAAQVRSAAALEADQAVEQGGARLPAPVRHGVAALARTALLRGHTLDAAAGRGVARAVWRRAVAVTLALDARARVEVAAQRQTRAAAARAGVGSACIGGARIGACIVAEAQVDRSAAGQRQPCPRGPLHFAFCSSADASARAKPFG